MISKARQLMMSLMCAIAAISDCEGRDQDDGYPRRLYSLGAVLLSCIAGDGEKLHSFLGITACNAVMPLPETSRFTCNFIAYVLYCNVA